MSGFLKTFTNSFKRKSWTKEEDTRKLLERSAEEHAQETGGCSAQTGLNTTDQSGTDPKTHAKRVLSILQDILLEDKKSEELNEAAEQVKIWAKLNGVTPDRTKGDYPQSWLREYLTIVEMSVKKHFPTLPPEGLKVHQDTVEYLQNAKSIMCIKVLGLVNLLKDAGLLSYLVESYNRHLFAVLEMLMDRSSSKNEALVLLDWVVNHTYLSHGLKGINNNQDDVIRVSDPLLLTGWFEKSTQKLLTLIQDYTSTTLQRVLQNNEAPCNYNEEDLVKVQVDVIECLNAVVQETKTISYTLQTNVKRVCCDELHRFVQSYVNAEKKRLEVQKPSETYLLHLFQIINSCRELRSYALTIMDSNNTKDSSTLKMLENMEAQVSVCLQKWFSDLAEEHLKKYFKEKDFHLHRLMELIQKEFATLPQKEINGTETKQHIVNAVYQSVTRAYLWCLMQRKCRMLERKWGDVNMQMIKDAALIHSVFSTLGTSDERQKMCLQKMSEILDCSDVDSLKLVCAALYKDFPKESKEHLPALLKWKKGLSKSQKKEILYAIQTFQNEDNITPHRMWWSYCLCCM